MKKILVFTMIFIVLFSTVCFALSAGVTPDWRYDSSTNQLTGYVKCFETGYSYYKMEIELDNGQTIYTSDNITNGQVVTNFNNVSINLPIGTYNEICYVCLVNPDGTYDRNAGVRGTITVK
jgi:hypothetical protein